MKAEKTGTGDRLNLIPLIDLLLVVMSFLLVTTLWSSPGVFAAEPPDVNPSELGAGGAIPFPRTDLSLFISTDRIETFASGKKGVLSFRAGEPDYEAVRRVLAAWKSRWPDRGAVIVQSHDQALYRHLIGILDLLNESEFSEVGVNVR